MALAKRFNPHKPHGTVTGDGRYAFEQDGQVYNAAYNAVNMDGTEIPMEPAPVVDPVKARPVDAPRDVDPADITEEDKNELDLVAWAEDKIKAPWGTVTATIQRLHDVVVSNKEEAKALIKQKMAKG